jgi:hypothetical protein
MAEPTIDHPGLPDARAARWAGYNAIRERLVRVWPSLLIVAAVGVVTAGQLAEDLADSPPLQLLSPESAVRRWTVIFAVLYMLWTSRFVDRLVDRSVGALEGAVDLPEARFKAYAEAMRRPGAVVDAALFLFALASVIALFWGIGLSLPTDDPITNAPRYLPDSGIARVVIVLGYAVVGWTILSLVWNTIRRARALGRLSHEKLAVDVFDTTRLLPLGNIALAASLAPAGIIVILLIGYGRPSQPLSWFVLWLATLASVLALLLPLRGIHRQMAHAKAAALAGLNAQIREIYEHVNAGVADGAETARTSGQVSTLVTLRKTVGEMTTWPFRDTLALGRAVLIASAPLIYTIVSEIIKVIWITPLAQ